jgi:hypothetical protein
VNLTPEAVERGLKYSLSLCGEVTHLRYMNPKTLRIKSFFLSLAKLKALQC